MITIKNARLVVTESISADVVDDLERELSARMELSERTILFRKSLGPPQYIQLVGDIIFWAPLAVFAASFLRRLGAKFADELYDYVKGEFKSEENEIISSIASSLLRAKNKSSIPLAVHFVLESDQNKYHTVTLFCGDYSEPSFTVALARFALFSRQIAALLDETQHIAGDASVEFDSNQEATVRWMDQDLNHHARQIILSSLPT